MAEWLQTRGFTKSEAKASVDAAVAEEGRARSFWDVVNGITAHARSVKHTDARVELDLLEEHRFGNGVVNLRYRIQS